MRSEKLHTSTIYVLGPLEISPDHFAVGERSYAAIKGNWPYYNKLRQALYERGEKELADAIGELDARARAAEDALDKANNYRKTLEGRNKTLMQEIRKGIDKIKELKAKHEAEIKELKAKKSNKKTVSLVDAVEAQKAKDEHGIK